MFVVSISHPQGIFSEIQSIIIILLKKNVIFIFKMVVMCEGMLVTKFCSPFSFSIILTLFPSFCLLVLFFHFHYPLFYSSYLYFITPSQYWFSLSHRGSKWILLHENLRYISSVVQMSINSSPGRTTALRCRTAKARAVSTSSLYVLPWKNLKLHVQGRIFKLIGIPDEVADN